MGPPPGDELGAPLPTPALALAASGATRVPLDPAWSVTVPEEFQNGAGVFALGEHFVLSAIDGAGPGTGGNTIRLLVGESGSGRQLRIQSVPKVISQPFVFSEKGRPKALVDVQDDPDAPARLVKIDLLRGRTEWSVPAGLGADSGPEVQFRAVGQHGSAVIGQVAARREHQSECGVCAVSLATGDTIWALPGKVPPAGTAALSTVVANGLVGTQLGDLTASTAYLLDADNGRVLAQLPSSWTADTMTAPVVLTPDGMVVLERPGEDGLRSAVAVTRHGRRSWRAQIRRDPVVAAAGGIVVLPDADGSYRAATVGSSDAIWTIPAAQAADERFTINLGQGDRLLGATATTAVVLASETGRPLYAEWFNWINPTQWDGRHFLGWSSGRMLTSHPGDRSPVGMQTNQGGEVPVFVAG